MDIEAASYFRGRFFYEQNSSKIPAKETKEFLR
jgi:hypothetical protein